MKFLIVLVLAAGINAETSADMAKRIMNLGQTFCTETEVSNVSFLGENSKNRRDFSSVSVWKRPSTNNNR